MVLNIMRADILLIARKILGNSQNRTYYMQNHQIRYNYVLYCIDKYTLLKKLTIRTLHAKKYIQILILIFSGKKNQPRYTLLM